PAIDQARVVEAEAAYDLKFFTTFQFANQNNLFPSQTNPTVDPFRGNIVFQDLQVQTGLRQDTATGGKIELRAQTDQFNRTGPVGLPRGQDPFWTNELTL